MRRKLSKLIASALLSALPAGALFAQEARTESFKGPAGMIKFELVKVPAGTLKGYKASRDAEPQDVEIKSFWIGKHEVTWPEYDVYAFQLDVPTEKEKIENLAKTRPSKPYAAPDYGYGHDGYPAMSIPLHSAKVYCEWLSKTTGKKFRLPTDAEWEHAARGGKDEKLDEKAVQDYAWVKENSIPEGGSEETTQAIGKKKPNGYGLHDMLGNVQEWVITPGATEEDKPNTRGGSYRSRAAAVNPSLRIPYSSGWQERDPQDPKSRWWLSDGPHVGFRVVMEE
jgi:formylglycine-generating enzyme required for sulfatase activity